VEILKKSCFTVLAIFSFGFGQQYTITLFDFPFVEVMMEPSPGTLIFKTKTTGLLDLFWPTDNTYSVSYDSASFNFKQTKKEIHQGSVKYSLEGVYDSKKELLVYDDIILKRPPDIQTIFSMLARIQESDGRKLDSKWFPMEHDGRLFETRFLFAGEDTVSVNRKDIVCDHYRLDINPVEDVTSLPVQADYFMNNIISTEAIRQVWVEKTFPFRIIQASVKLYGLNIVARIVHV